jgi:preprotein translocase subunit SecD
MKKKNLLSRTIIIVFVTLVGLYLVIGPRRRPRLHDFTWSGIKSTLRSNIHLGLDLQGGSHLVMRVKTEEYLKRLTSENYTAHSRPRKTPTYRVKDGRAETGNGNYRVVLEAADAAKVNEIKEAVEKKIELADTSVLELLRLRRANVVDDDGKLPSVFSPIMRPRRR